MIELDANWKWDDDWNVDVNRAVDNEGLWPFHLNIFNLLIFIL